VCTCVVHKRCHQQVLKRCPGCKTENIPVSADVACLMYCSSWCFLLFFFNLCVNCCAPVTFCHRAAEIDACTGQPGSRTVKFRRSSQVSSAQLHVLHFLRSLWVVALRLVFARAAVQRCVWHNLEVELRSLKVCAAVCFASRVY